MKQLLLLMILFIGMVGTVAAQAKKSSNKKKTVKQVATKKTSLNNASTHAAMDQRKIYHWNDGQAATPTGHEATGINGTQMVSKDAHKNKGGVHNGRGSRL